MIHGSIGRNVSSSFLAGALLLCSLTMCGAAAAQSPVAQPPYVLSVFAKSVAGPTGYTQPDSIVQWRDHVIIAFGNHVAKDGSDGKSSTIVEYSLSGHVKRMFQVTGHNDGLRIIGEDHLWALQNEDANPNLVVIDLESGHQKTFAFAPTVHGGGYDDIVVQGDDIFLSASNPNTPGGVNIFPALVTARLAGNMVVVEPVLNGNANATDIPTGMTVQLNLMDPDSMSIDPRGNIVLDDQGDGQLIFIRHASSNNPQVGRLSITLAGAPTTVDDTTFAPAGHTFLLFTDLAGDTIYRLDSPPFGFEPGVAYSASDTDHFVGTLNLDTGVITTAVTGLGSARGMLFVRPDVEKRHGHER